MQKLIGRLATSAWGHLRRFERGPATSAMPPIPDARDDGGHEDGSALLLLPALRAQEVLAQLVFEDLAGGVARQRCDELEAAR